MLKPLAATLSPKKVSPSLEEDGRYWIYPEGEAPADGKHPAKHITKVKAGPGGVTCAALMRHHSCLHRFEAWLPWKSKMAVSGYSSWYRRSRQVPRIRQATSQARYQSIKAGPGGITLRGPDSETIMAYIAAADGFVTGFDDGRIWVFEKGSNEAAAFLAEGKHPAKHITRVAAGPMGKTVRAPDVR